MCGLTIVTEDCVNDTDYVLVALVYTNVFIQCYMLAVKKECEYEKLYIDGRVTCDSNN